MSCDGRNSIVDDLSRTDINHLDFNPPMMDSIDDTISAHLIAPQTIQFVLQRFAEVRFFLKGLKSGTNLSLEQRREVNEGLFDGGRNDNAVFQEPFPKTFSRGFPAPPRLK